MLEFRPVYDEVMAHAVASVGQAFFDKTKLSGITEMTSALLDVGSHRRRI